MRHATIKPDSGRTGSIPSHAWRDSGRLPGRFAVCHRAAAACGSEVRMAAVPTEKGGQDISGHTTWSPTAEGFDDAPGTRRGRSARVERVCRESGSRIRPAARRAAEHPAPMAGAFPSLPSLAFPWRCRGGTRPRRAFRHGGTGQLAEMDRRGSGRNAWASMRAGITASSCSTRRATWSSRGRSGLDSAAAALCRHHPVDPQKHVWIVDDHKHVVYKFTNDGKTKVLIRRTTAFPATMPRTSIGHVQDWFPTALRRRRWL